MYESCKFPFIGSRLSSKSSSKHHKDSYFENNGFPIGFGEPGNKK